jgi:hypothetical protein
MYTSLIFIISDYGKKQSPSSEEQMGAFLHVRPFSFRIAYTVLKPPVVNLIEFPTKSGNIELHMQEIAI